jgi:hypothetical protein
MYSGTRNLPVGEIDYIDIPADVPIPNKLSQVQFIINYFETK